ncbi:MAG: UDP-3-O-(3-hydroxymyristoyl)glucosamine N-acyltransferase [Bauldia sp.]|nr:MAG: UDP-3-O-(3-hydroxymyristoyl)glucosamine N-acyltransferase [Bauldia sp.]
MMEPGFFEPPRPVTVAEIARLTEAKLAGGDPERRIAGIAPLDSAQPMHLSFFESKRFADALATTRAGACFCVEAHVGLVPPGTAALVTPSPHKAFAVAASRLYPAATRPQALMGGEGISPAASVHATARVEAGATVEAGAVVGPAAEIGRGTLVAAGAVIGEGVRIGRDAAIGPNATVIHALVGNRVTLHPGVRVGQDGFGYVPGPAGHLKVPQIGRVIIQDDVEIGANTTIDRGSIRDTIIGEGTKIDNLVQIAHNVVIGRHCLIAGQVGISGSVTIGDFVMLGGNAGIRDNVTIGHGARIAAAAAVHTNIPAGETWGGYPALRVDKWRRQMRAFNRLAGSGPNNKDGPDGG